MKIIKKGIKPKNRKYIRTCISCGCIFEFNEDEMYPMLDERKGFISCPCCEESLIVVRGETNE